VRCLRGVLAPVLPVSVCLCICMTVCRGEVSAWGSGTGAAGVVGSLSYAGLTAINVSPRTALLMMLVVPCVFFLTSVQ